MKRQYQPKKVRRNKECGFRKRMKTKAGRAVLKRRLGAARPANTTVCCALVVEGAKVEIEVTARVRGAARSERSDSA